MQRAGRLLATGLFGALALLLAWGLIEPYLIDVERSTVSLPDLPPAWEGARVGVIGDFQLGMWLANEATVRRAVARLVEERPAVVLLAGDFLYPKAGDPAESISEAVDMLRPLTTAGIPTYAVLGNHDYSMAHPDDAPALETVGQLTAALAEVGVIVLQNEARPLRRDGGAEPLYLVGLGARYPGLDRPEEALGSLPAAAPRLVLMHNPDSFPALPAGGAPLAIAGHTHGGQLRLPGAPDWSWLTYVEEDEVHVDGWVDDFGASGNRLYVNRGLGMSLLPLRINCPPEITIFTLAS